MIPNYKQLRAMPVLEQAATTTKRLEGDTYRVWLDEGGKGSAFAHTVYVEQMDEELHEWVEFVVYDADNPPESFPDHPNLGAIIEALA